MIRCLRAAATKALLNDFYGSCFPNTRCFVVSVERIADDFFELLGREIGARHRRDTTSDDGNDRQLHVVRIAVGRHRVVRPPDVDARDPPRNHDARIRRRQPQYPIDGVLEGDQ